MHGSHSIVKKLIITLLPFAFIHPTYGVWFDWITPKSNIDTKKLICMDFIGSLPRPVLKNISRGFENQIRMFLTNPLKKSSGYLGQIQTTNKEFQDLILRNPTVNFLKLSAEITNARKKEPMDIYLVDGAIILVRQKQLLGQMLWTITQSLNAAIHEEPEGTLGKFNYVAQQIINEIYKFDHEIKDLVVRSVSNDKVDYYYIRIATHNTASFRYFTLKFLDQLMDI